MYFPDNYIVRNFQADSVLVMPSESVVHLLQIGILPVFKDLTDDSSIMISLIEAEKIVKPL
jgi:hypothetical protein